MAARTKMSREDRAKQFMPFAALKGYEEAIREKEKPIVCPVEISEDKKEELDRKLSILKINDMAEIIYYHNGEYIKQTGMVSKLDISARYIRIVNTKIELKDIYNIEII